MQGRLIHFRQSTLLLSPTMAGMEFRKKEVLDRSLAGSDGFFAILQAKGLDKEEVVRQRVVANLVAVYQALGLHRYAQKEAVEKALSQVEETLEPMRPLLNRVVYNAIGVPPKDTYQPAQKSYVVGHWGPAVGMEHLLNMFGVEVVTASLPNVRLVDQADFSR